MRKKIKKITGMFILVKATLIMEGGYKVLTQDEVLNIFKKSMQ